MKKRFVNKYLRQVKRLYRGKRKTKKQFICELEDALLCYCEEHPDATYSDLLSEFGEPSNIKNLLSFHNAKDLHKRNMVIHWTLIILICIVVLLAAWFTIDHMLAMYDFSQGYYVEYFNDDPSVPNNINPVNGKPDPTPIATMNFN